MISGMRPPAHFVEQHVRLDRELGDGLAILDGLAVVRAQFHHVAHFHSRDVQLDRQGAGVFHRVVEDGAILLPRQTPPKRLLGTNGISSPVNQSTELVADLRDELEPTTSPT